MKRRTSPSAGAWEVFVGAVRVRIMGHETPALRTPAHRPSTGKPCVPGSARPRRSPPAAARSSWPAPTAKPRRPSPATSRCTAGTVRNAIHAFAREGLDCLREKSSRPHSARPLLDEAHGRPAQGHPPPAPGRSASRPAWTLDLVAEVCHAKGRTPRRLSDEAVRQALKRLGIGWKRAKQWITSPDPAYARKKSPRPADPAGGGAPGLGAGLPGRDVVEPAGLAGDARLGRREPPAAAGRAGGAEGRPGPEGAVVLRAVAGGHGPDAAAVRVGPAGQPGDRGLPGLGLRAVGGGGEEGVAAGVGQRGLARQQAGAGGTCPLSAAASRERWDDAAEVLERATAAKQVDAAVLHVVQKDESFTRHFGKAASGDAMFLLGSISKPINVTAVMTLFDQGKFQLDDRVKKFLPAFTGDGRGD